MASISLRAKSYYHVRSASIPSVPHPMTPQVDETLCRLRSSFSTFSSLSSVGNKLNMLEEMYDSFDDFLRLPTTRQTFGRDKKLVEEILDGYMRLLDLCVQVKDIYLYTNQDVQELLSMLRRRKDANEMGKYLISRNKAKKGIRKSLKDLKDIKIKNKNTKNKALGSLFFNVEEASIEVFESLMANIGGSKSRSRLSSLVAIKYFGDKISKDDVSNTNEFEKVDYEVNFLINKKTETKEFEDLKTQLTDMAPKIQDLEERLEHLFRRLVKTRVALLNILNH